MPTEARVTVAVKKYLDSIRNIWYYKVSDRYTAGLPDIIGVINGRFFSIELKKPGKHGRKLQLYRLKKIKEAGGIGEVAVSVNDVKKIIQSALCN